MAYTSLPLSEFDYDAMDDEVWGESEEEEEEEEGRGEGMSEAELEKLLLQNISDEEEGEEAREPGGKSTQRNRSEPLHVSQLLFCLFSCYESKTFTWLWQ